MSEETKREPPHICSTCKNLFSGSAKCAACVDGSGWTPRKEGN